jgi:hypothetical protein
MTMSMDPWLAQVYGTNGGASEDLEKLAQAEMAQQMAAQEGIDLSQLSPEQIAALGQEVLGPEGQQQGGEGEITEETYAQAQEILTNPAQYDPAIVEQAQGIMAQVEQMQAAQQGGEPQGQPGAQPMGAPQGQAQAQPQMAGQQAQPGQAEQVKIAEAQAKFEEADFLGRVMAHSFNQESEKIAAAKLGPGNLMGAAEHHVRSAGRAVKGAVESGLGHAKARLHPDSSSPLHHVGKAARHVGQHPTAYAAGAAGAAGLGAGYAAGSHTKEATVNAIEKAAMVQAANILQQNGIDPATGQQLQPQAPAPAIAPAGGAPQQNPQQALGELVEKRAHQILRGLGYSI